MSKLVRLDPHFWPTEDYGYWCPGCNSGHEVPVSKKNSSGGIWTFNGNVGSPTFAPSINLKINTPDMGARYQPDINSIVCHHFVRDGKIQFLGDCTHALRGQTVDLPDIPDGRYMTSERL